VRGERFQVRTYASATGRVKTGNGQNDGQRMILEIIQRLAASAQATISRRPSWGAAGGPRTEKIAGKHQCTRVVSSNASEILRGKVSVMEILLEKKAVENRRRDSP
jgi:hypothetical protein